ncbi:hypothetical protein BD779DRAFT_1612929 [Infundibulicybe gibba]|nr:hypothetical protein BD779DRAFT_1612929 [Infundibulicybe gibba]
MASMWGLFPIFVFAVLSINASLYTGNEQMVMVPPPTPAQGTLRRFIINETTPIDHIVEHNSLDVWHRTPSYIDLYFPNNLPVPRGLNAIPHTVTPIFSEPAATPRFADWNLTSLQETTYHDAYHPLYEIDTFMRELAAIHPDTVSITELGHSGQGREMRGMTISRPDEPDGKGARKERERSIPRLGFVITGAQHAREWVATATSTYIAHALLSNTSEPHSLSTLLEHFDFHIIPVPNPDGYDYTWESDRFWYKNRQVMGPHAKCVGLDINRNWGYKWKPEAIGMIKKSKQPTDPCSTFYPGHRPFESPEANNIANFVTQLPNLVAFLDLRSYGQMLSSPYSYSCKRMPKDAEDQIEAALGAVNALKMVHGTPFMTGDLCSNLYRAPGNIVDWMYARAGIKYAYAVHLRDTGTYGFSLPARFIRPVGEETGNMIDYLAKFIVKRMKDQMPGRGRWGLPNFFAV